MRQKGFSLIELLLYLGITAIVIGLFGGILITILRIQTQQTASRQVITELNFVMGTIKRHVFDSVSLTVTTSTLTVGTGATSTDPTVFTSASGTVYMSEAGGDAFPLSSDKVIVDNLAFTDLHYASSQAVQIVLTIEYNTTNPGQAVTQTLQSTAAPLRKSSIQFQEDIFTSLADYYRFDNNALDSAGSHNGTLQNGASFVAGKIGKALSLDGIDDYATTSAMIYSATNPYTISFWIKGAAQDGGAIYSETNSNDFNPAFWFATKSDGTIKVIERPDTGEWLIRVESAGIVFDDTWHLVTFTDEAGAGKLYIDGIQDPNDFSYSAAASTFDVVSIGLQFNGLIDDLRVYSRALTQAQIEWLYMLGSS